MAFGSVIGNQKTGLYFVILCLLMCLFMLCFQTLFRNESQPLESRCDQSLYWEIKNTWKHLTTTFFEKLEIAKPTYIDIKLEFKM